MAAHIRPASPNSSSDLSALSRICVLTANAGKDASDNHIIAEMPGYVYAVPYGAPAVRDVPESKTFAFILESDEPDSKGEAVGYVVGTADTKAYEGALEKVWWPALREKHPLALKEAEEDGALKAGDKSYLEILHKPNLTPAPILTYSPAHIHINILPSHQRRGYGRVLIGAAARHLRETWGVQRLWLGIDPKNGDARTFYKKIGFKDLREVNGVEGVEGLDGEYLGVDVNSVIV